LSVPEEYRNPFFSRASIKGLHEKSVTLDAESTLVESSLLLLLEDNGQSLVKLLCRRVVRENFEHGEDDKELTEDKERRASG
jgi:hypothetical protein